MPSKPKTPHLIDQQAAKRFKLVRKFLKLNQSETAEICGSSQAMISKIEKGVKEIPQQAIKMLFIKKNISADYLINGSVNMEFKKSGGSELVTNIRELQAEMEIMKSQLWMLMKERGLKAI